MATKQETLEALKQAYDALLKWHGSISNHLQRKQGEQSRCPYCLTMGLLHESIKAMQDETDE
jgi:hypothetical protein